MNITEDEIFSETEAIAKNGFERNLAFIIGINNYSNGISPLKTAVNDAKKLVEVLREKYKYQVWVCLDEVATLTNLNQLLERTLPEQVRENDRLLFYFAGHGVALNGDDGPAGYLIPQDAKGGDTDSYLPMTKLHDALSKLPCRHFLGILDCCFAGAFRWSSTRDLLTSPEVIHKERYDRFITDAAWQIITSSASDQKALDNFNLDTQRGQVGNHSPFAAALLEALEGAADAYPPAKNGKPAGDGVITATELYLHLRDRVEISTEKYRLRQTPSIWCLNKHDKGEYIFLTPGHELNLPPAPPLDESQNPYRGLKSFDEEHSELFFGRTELVEKLQAFLKIHPLTVVLGASGSGKSSVVKAGLIPNLKKETKETSNKWCILSPIRPGETPFRALNNALVNAQLPKLELQNQQKTLTESIAVWAKNNPNSKLLIFIDQSEEIITLCHSENERKEFFQQIHTAINAHQDKLRVVLSLRSDFEPQIRDAGLNFVPTVLQLGNTALKNRWQSGRFIVPAMTRGELREAIEKPAEARVMYFQPHELVEQLIDEVDNMPGALPLLSFALRELYLKYLKRQRDAENRGITIDRALTQKDYQDLGGVIQSLTQRADEEYEALVKENPAYAQIIRHVMLRMVALGGGELARRQVPLSELEYPPEKDGLVKQVIERFTNARLLVKGEDAEGNFYVEPAHDALVRSWQRLLNWVKEEKNLRLQRRLTPAALEWKSQQQPRFLWNVDPYLDVLQKEVLNSENNWLNKVETEFVQRSVGKKSFNTKRNWGIAIAVMLGLSGLTIAALIGQGNALIGQIRASRQSSEANLRSNQELDALLESLRAGKSLKQPLLQLVKPDNQIQNQLKETLQKAVYQVKERNRLKGDLDNGSGVGVSFSPDGQRLATESNGTVRLWDLQGKPLKDWKADSSTNASFSPDGQLLATAKDNGTVRLWNLQGEMLKEWNADQGWLIPVNFSPNGQLLATAGGTGIVRLWNLQGQMLKEWNAGQGWIWSINFSPDGQRLATVGYSGTIRLWKLQGQQLIGWEWKASQRPLRSVSFSPNGQLLATTGDDGIARLWNLQGHLLGELKGDQGWIWNVSFSPDGQQLATAGINGTVRLWNLQGHLLAELKGNQGVLRSVSFSPNGQLLATAGDSDIAQLWDLRGQPLTELKGHQEVVKSVSFSPDGQRLTTAGENGTVGLWDLWGQLLKELKRNDRKIISVSFSPDGQRLATAQEDGIARLWDLQGQLLKELKRNDHKITSVSFSPDGQQLASVEEDGTARLWNLQTGQSLIKFSGNQRKITSVSFSPDGQRLATIEEDDKVHLRDLQGKHLAEEPVGHANGLKSVSFSPDGQRLAVAGDDGIVRVWNLQGQPLTKQLSVWQATQGLIWNLKFSPDNQQLATAGDDGTVRLWDLQGQPLATWKVDQGQVWSISFSPDGKRLATAGFSGNAKLLQIESFDELMQRGCNWVRDYLKNNPNVSERDRRLCDDVIHEKADAQSVQNPGTPPSSSSGRFIVNLLSRKCIDVLGVPGTANDAKLVLWTCETSGLNLGNGLPTNQKWTLGSDGFIRNSLSGKCIDVKGDPGITNGAPLVLWDCETSGINLGNGLPTNQKWTLGSDGFIRNRSSGKCIDVKGGPGITNGAPLVLWDCETSGLNRDNGSPTDQRWGLQ